MDLNDYCSLRESSSDMSFIKSLHEFILKEKQLFGCSDEVEADEMRYNIYSAAFNKIIDYTTTYKPVLSAMKKGYDDFIAALKKNQHKSQVAHKKLQAMSKQPTSLIYYQRRAAQLQERIAAIQKDTTELQAELRKLRDCEKERELEQQDDQAPVQIPGLSFSESLNPAVLSKHLKDLEQRRADLSKKKSQYVPIQVKTDLDIKMKATLDQRDELILENESLQLRYKQFTYLNEAIDLWEKSENHLPLLEFLSSELERVSEIKACHDDNIDRDEAQDDDPAKVNESQLVVDHIKRFAELFETGEYEAAALHAAKSPDGVLINMETMKRFKSVTVYEGEIPPVLLFFQAVMLSAQPGMELSLEGVCCALQYGCIELVTFWVTQHRLTYSEELGDVLCRHRDEDPCIVDTCLALAYSIYSACRLLSKAVLSMCKRGLISAALELIYLDNDFTVDDCIFVLRGCPSLALLQNLTQQCGNRPALLSVGFICHSLLNSDSEDLVFELLEEIQADSQGALEKSIVDDELCSAECWSEIAMRCDCTNRPHLAQDIISTLLCQPGAVRLSPDAEGAKLMEDVFM